MPANRLVVSHRVRSVHTRVCATPPPSAVLLCVVRYLKTLSQSKAVKEQRALMQCLVAGMAPRLPTAGLDQRQGRQVLGCARNDITALGMAFGPSAGIGTLGGHATSGTKWAKREWGHRAGKNPGRVTPLRRGTLPAGTLAKAKHLWFYYLTLFDNLLYLVSRYRRGTALRPEGQSTP